MTRSERRYVMMFLGWSAIWIAVGLSVCAALAAPIPADASRYRLPLIQITQAYCGLGCPSATFAAQIHQESRWNPDAKSPVGAQGMAQFMPATTKWIAGVYPRDLKCPSPQPPPASGRGGCASDPVWAMRALVLYDKWLWDRVKAESDCERMAFALSGYNGGLGYVYKRQKLSATPARCLGAACDLNPGIRPAAQVENRNYPRLILLTHAPLYARAGWGKGVCA